MSPIIEAPGYRAWSCTGLPVISAPYDIDVDNVAGLSYALLTASRPGAIVLLDLTETEYCSLSACRSLAMASQLLDAAQGELRVICSARALKFITLMGFHRSLRIYRSLTQACHTKEGCLRAA